MHDKPSFLRIVSSQGAELSEAIAAEIQAICRAAARPIRSGEGIKAQILRSWRNLGKPPFWRVRAGWYLESGGWSAAAVRDFQTRYCAFLDREARRADQAQAIEQVKQGLSEPDHVRIARADYQELVTRIAALEAALRIQP